MQQKIKLKCRRHVVSIVKLWWTPKSVTFEVQSLKKFPRVGYVPSIFWLRTGHISQNTKGISTLFGGLVGSDLAGTSRLLLLLFETYPIDSAKQIQREETFAQATRGRHMYMFLYREEYKSHEDRRVRQSNKGML